MTDIRACWLHAERLIDTHPSILSAVVNAVCNYEIVSHKMLFFFYVVVVYPFCSHGH